MVAVTKQTQLDDIELMYALGHRDFGENRVEALLERAIWAREQGLVDIRWHFIGHLQSNKINKLLKVPDLFAIHSVDSLKLLQKLMARLGPEHVNLKFFIQVKTSPEDEKSGFVKLEEIREALDLGRERILGLMTMAPIRTSDVSTGARECFGQLKELKEGLADPKRARLGLSMGMSGDYREALEFGSDWVRIGQGLFA